MNLVASRYTCLVATRVLLACGVPDGSSDESEGTSSSATGASSGEAVTTAPTSGPATGEHTSGEGPTTSGGGDSDSQGANSGGESSGTGDNATGMRHGSSDRLVIYFEGGGACFDAATCLLNDGFSNFNAPQFTAWANTLGGGGMFDADAADNPVADWNFVYVPYCTNDVHAGDREDFAAGPEGGR